MNPLRANNRYALPTSHPLEKLLKKVASNPSTLFGISASDGSEIPTPASAETQALWSLQALPRQASLADQIYESIIQEIAEGKLTQGQKLPTEASLCKSFGVSRPVLREALARLKADGLLIGRQGSGNYVRLQPEADFLTFAPNGSIAEILRGFEFRVGVEGEAAFFAAERRTAEDLRKIALALDELSLATQTGEVGNDRDYRFHVVIADAAKNSLFSSTIKQLHDTMTLGMNVTRSLSLRSPPVRALRVQREHEAIYSAIVKGDGAGARYAMRTHIINARLRMLSRDTA